MWSFDDEESKLNQDDEENTSNENNGTESPEENGDSFGERDPFSRGGDFYSSYSGASGNSDRKKSGGSGKGGAFLAILICAAIFL